MSHVKEPRFTYQFKWAQMPMKNIPKEPCSEKFEKRNHLMLCIKNPKRDEIVTGIIYCLFFSQHFVGINFRNLGSTKDFAGINFRRPLQRYCGNYIS